jgi:hypothetical protein
MSWSNTHTRISIDNEQVGTNRDFLSNAKITVIPLKHTANYKHHIVSSLHSARKVYLCVSYDSHSKQTISWKTLTGCSL